MSTPHAPLLPADFEGLEAPLKASRAGDATQVVLKVQSVTTMPGHPYREVPFSVVLEGPAVPALPQGIHVVEHPRLGTLELFMVPIGQDAACTRYELTFN